jgi:hypothetical protein
VEGYLDSLERIGIPRAVVPPGGRRGRRWRSGCEGDGALRADAGARQAGSAAGMTPTLESLATCFQGLLPAQLFTCSPTACRTPRT